MTTTQLIRSDRRRCYTIPVAQDPRKHGGFVPSLVFENVSGHFPMMGRGDGAAPWVWGKTLVEAENTCDAYNLKQFGLCPEECRRIISTTFRP